MNLYPFFGARGRCWIMILSYDCHISIFNKGKLIKEGVLVWENMAGYKKLIKVFDEVDKSNDGQIDKEEMKNWIHDR